MSVYKQKGSKNWWYKFTWHGRQIRESTKQLNKRVAEQIEAGHKVSLAKARLAFATRSRSRHCASSSTTISHRSLNRDSPTSPRLSNTARTGSRTCASSVRSAGRVTARCDHRRQDRCVYRQAPSDWTRRCQHQPATRSSAAVAEAGGGMGQGGEGVAKSRNAERRKPPRARAQLR